jgi:hypothetical protein
MVWVVGILTKIHPIKFVEYIRLSSINGRGIPVFGLLIVVRVEVDVVYDDGVGGREVDAQPACTRRQQEHEYILRIILVYQVLSVT